MRRPAMVNAVILPGEHARFDSARKVWIICRYSSCRVDGKMKRKVIDLAEVTPMGCRTELSGERPKPPVIDCICLEYGISRVLMERIPARWLKIAGKHREPIFLDAIRQVFPNSYLLHNKTYIVPTKQRDKVNVPLIQKRLWELYEEEGITMDKLENLRSLSMLCYPDGRTYIVAPTAEHSRLLEEFGVSLV